MPFTIPNEADAFNANQAEPDSVDFDILTFGSGVTGVFAGCAGTAHDQCSQGRSGGAVASCTGGYAWRAFMGW